MDLFQDIEDLLQDIEELSDEDNMMDPIQTEEEEEDKDVDRDLDRRLADFVQRMEGDGDSDSAILECNSLMADIDDQIVIIDILIRDNYRLRFSELECLVPNPIVYARVVQKIGNESDVVDLHGLVPPAVAIAVSIITASTGGIRKPPLPEQVLQRTIDNCDRVIRLHETKQKLLDFIEARMPLIAPNLSAIIGNRVAAKLMGAVDCGLSSLASMPACNLQLLGAARRTLAGFSSATIRHVDYLEETDIFQLTPPSLKARASRLLAAKSALAARVDCMKGDPMGKTGVHMRDEILKKIEIWQQPPPAKLPKPLPVPDSHQRRKKRAGVRRQNTKDKYKMTEMRKLTNRMPFGVVAEDSSLGDGNGLGYGMLRRKLGRLPVERSKLGAKLAHVFKKKSPPTHGTGATTSTLAFTLQGIDLSIHRPLDFNGTQSVYFF